MEGIFKRQFLQFSYDHVIPLHSELFIKVTFIKYWLLSCQTNVKHCYQYIPVSKSKDG